MKREDKPQWATPNDEALPCIVCDKALETWNEEFNQPVEGLAFWTSGHWPSSIFDDCGEGYKLELSVCNECLFVKASKQIAEVPPRRRGDA